MTKESRSLLWALQHKKPIAEVGPLITPETAKLADTYYNLRPLFWALSYGASPEVIKRLLDAFPAAAQEKDPDEGSTPLHYVEKLDAEALKLLITACPPSTAGQKDAYGQLPLHVAAEHCASAEAVGMLLAANEAAAAVRDDLGRLPIKLAMENDADVEVLSLLKAANPDGAASVVLAPPEGALPHALIFPGQGSQYVKMLDGVKDLPEVQRLLTVAKAILGYDLLQVCLEGPEEKLQDTRYCQPAMFVGGLAAVEKLRKESPARAKRPCAVAGLSLGEYTALTVAGVFSWEDGLELVRARAEAMAEAAEAEPQAMLSVAGLSEVVVKSICAEVKEKHGPGAVCQLSNHLFHQGFTVGGTKAAVEECQVRAQDARALQARLIKASGGFHTGLMEPAKAKLQAKLQEILPRMGRARCKVYMNVTGRPIDWSTPPEKIVELLAMQLTNPVRWKGCLEAMLDDGIEEFYECGPMKQLKAMLKRVDNAAWTKAKNVEV